MQNVTKENKIVKDSKYIKNDQASSLYTNPNDILTTFDSPKDGSEYIGKYDLQGNKTGFGIQKMPNGNIYKGYFSNDKAKGWGIYTNIDGEIFKGEYEEDRTTGYGELKNNNGATYYGYWVDEMQFGILE